MVEVRLSMTYEQSSRNSGKSNPDLTQGIGTELVGVVSATETSFSRKYLQIKTAHDWALTNLQNSTITLTLPLGSLLRLFVYRFQEAYGMVGLMASAKTPVSFGKSEGFVVTSGTKSLTVKINITPNGTPCVSTAQPSGHTNNAGRTATLNLKLLTQPKEPVSLPLSVSQADYADISSANLTFTPKNWDTEQTVTLTGKTADNFSGIKTLQLVLGAITSEDTDYQSLDPEDVEFKHYETVKPLLTEIQPIATYTPDNTPTYIFSSSENGTVSYGGRCTSTSLNTSDNMTIGDNIVSSSTTALANADNNTIVLEKLTDGTYDNCSIELKDYAGNTQKLDITTFTVDTVKPVLSELNAVSSPTNDNTSDYSFFSSESGTIQYAGSCSSTSTSAKDNSSGDNNTIKFKALNDGTYSNCIITVKDNATNVSDNLSVSSFTVDTIPLKLLSSR